MCTRPRPAHKTQGWRIEPPPPYPSFSRNTGIFFFFFAILYRELRTLFPAHFFLRNAGTSKSISAKKSRDIFPSVSDPDSLIPDPDPDIWLSPGSESRLLLNTDLDRDPGFYNKMVKKLQLKHFFFDQKSQICLPQPL